MGKHGICPLSVAPLRQRIVCIPITPPQCGLSPKETRPSCAAADCCYCACCSSPHRSARCCFWPARLPRAASDGDRALDCTTCCFFFAAARPRCRIVRSTIDQRVTTTHPGPPACTTRETLFGCHTAPPALPHTPRAQSFADCLRWSRNLNRPHLADAPRASSSAHGPDVRLPKHGHTRHLMPLTACASRAARLTHYGHCARCCRCCRL